jgi:hypothetical protein
MTSFSPASSTASDAGNDCRNFARILVAAQQLQQPRGQRLRLVRRAALHHAGQAALQPVDRFLRRLQPRDQCLLVLAACAHPGAELLAQRRKFRLQFRGGPCAAHGRPRAIQLRHAIGGNQLLVEQGARAGNQGAGFGDGGAPGFCRIPARFRGAVQALVPLAIFIHRILERVFLRQGLKGGELQLGGGRLTSELQEPRIVRARRKNPVAPGLGLGWGKTLCALHVGLDRRPIGIGGRIVLPERVLEHGHAISHEGSERAF